MAKTTLAVVISDELRILQQPTTAAEIYVCASCFGRLLTRRTANESVFKNR